MIEQHLRDWIISDAAIYAELEDRVYPQFIPENAEYPAVSYAMISDQVLLSMSGPTAVRSPRVQITVVAKSQPKVAEISELIKNRINAWEAAYVDMEVSSCFAEGGVYLSLDYFTPFRYGMILEAFLNWVPV